MKTHILSFLSIWFSLLLAGCSTELLSEDSEMRGPDESELEVYRIEVVVNGSNPFSRAYVDDDAIESLTLAFYYNRKGSIILDRVVDAVPVNEFPDNGENRRRFSVEYETVPGQFPDLALAFANVSIEEAIASYPGVDKVAVNGLNDNGTLVMSSARYFDSEQKDAYFSQLNANNFTDPSNHPVDILLERTVAKVSLSDFENFEDADFGKTSVWIEGVQTPLYFHFTAWDVNATDAYSYLIKNIGTSSSYNAFIDELGANDPASNWLWNDGGPYTQYPMLHWACSANYSGSVFPAPGIEEDDADVTIHKSYNELNREASAVYAAETTRRKSDFDTPNALPVLVIAGYYTIGSADAQRCTFYRSGSRIVKEDDFPAFVSTLQHTLFTSAGQPVNSNLLSEIAEIVAYDSFDLNRGLTHNYFTLRIKEDADLNGIFDSGGNPVDDYSLQALNQSLANEIGYWEKYFDGAVVFTSPIAHLGYKANADEQATGAYGLVRNHHYHLSLSGLEGIGRGIADPDRAIGEMGKPGDIPGFTLKISFKVEDWTTHEQSVTVTPQ